MGKITLDLLRKRAEHNEGIVSTLTEVAFHQQYIEKIELLNQACRHLKVVYLQNNLISKIENLHRLKELEHLNLAINNITFIENLERCESLRKLDLTLNFISIPALLSVASLQPCENLIELVLLGNPCTQWKYYRPYVIGLLPQLKALLGHSKMQDSEEITGEERNHAESKFAYHHGLLVSEARKQINSNAPSGSIIDLSRWLPADNDAYDTVAESADIPKPWCPETRILESRIHEKLERQAEERKRDRSLTNIVPDNGAWRQRKLHTEFPDIDDDSSALQCNEAGEWEFSLEEEIYTLSHYLVLTINLGRHCDTHDIRLDIRPKLARVLARGHLLQLHLPQEVICDKVACRRSMATGKLVIEMPVEHPNRFLIDAKKRQKERLIRNGSSGNNNTEKALVYIEAAESSQLDDDALPPLCI